MNLFDPTEDAAEAMKQRRQQLEALEYRQTGASIAQIAAKLGVTELEVNERICNALAAILGPTTDKERLEQQRQLELQTLDRLQLALWPEASQGNPKAIDRILKVMDQRHGLVGLKKAAVTQEAKKEQSRETTIVMLPNNERDDVAQED